MYDFIHMWAIKQKATNEQQQKNKYKSKLIDTDNSTGVTREARDWGENAEGKGGKMYGDRRRLGFGWWAYSRVDRCNVRKS